MNILIDTHILIWSLVETNKLSKVEKQILLSTENMIYVSVVSLWEISLKYSIGKLNFQGIGIDDIPFGIKENGFKILDLNENEALLFFKLKSVLNHKDPFDRLLIWQCIQNKYHFLTRDSHIAFYEDQGLQVANI